MSELIDRQALRSAHGLGTDCADCKQDARSCQYDRDFSMMDFCEWIDDAPAYSPWHRVEDGLPQHQDPVLVYVPGFNDGENEYVPYVGMAYFTQDIHGGFWCGTDGNVYGAIGILNNPTHWMPLPEPPKEDA